MIFSELIEQFYYLLQSMAELLENNPKVLNIARKYSSLPSTQRNSDIQQQIPNIFSRARLQRSSMISLQKKYQVVGLNEIKEHIKKSKRTNMVKKNNTGCFGLSLKSYTVKSNDMEQDMLLTKQEVLSILKYHEKQGHREQNKQSSWHRAKKQKNGLRNFSDQSMNKYQEKMQRLSKYTLHEKKQNIQSREWTKILRTSMQLSDIFRQKQNNFQKVKRNGIKIKAKSKMIKQFQWVQRQKQNSLFELLDQKNMKLAHLRMRDSAS